MESELERTLGYYLRLNEGTIRPPEQEFRFDPRRKWRFDFAWPEEMVAVEIEGGVWNDGRHTRGHGFTNDCEKYNEATLAGWRVLRVTGEQIRDGSAVNWIQRALGAGREPAPF